jgi:hypothetical protein
VKAEKMTILMRSVSSTYHPDTVVGSYQQLSATFALQFGLSSLRDLPFAAPAFDEFICGQ